MKRFPKQEALRLRGVVEAYFTQLPRQEVADNVVKYLSVPPGKKKPPRESEKLKRRLKGKLLADVLEDLVRYGFEGVVERVNSARTIDKRMEILRDFLLLLQAEHGAVESWPTPPSDPAPSRLGPLTVEDLLRSWGI